ncbi:MAG: hypothetical protein H6649_02280 [Caldilineae bacterium]|nr:hypothetical protein [Anaerolineae bacterium]MCB9152869.1 hypothetical protein [Caldilineae bacterium]
MASIPVLSSITELLTGTFKDEFKKLFQPSSLVAAAIFLALNLVLVFPPLVRHRVTPFVTLQRLPTVSQILIGTLVLVAIGYLINSLDSAFVALMNGNAFRDSPLVHKWLQKRQQDRYRALCLASAPGPDTETDDKKSERAIAAYRLAMEYPSGMDAVAPTRLGNILLNPASYAKHQYGVHLNTIWPIMSLALKNDDPELFGNVSEGSSRYTFLAVVAVLLLAVAVELLIVGLVVVEPLQYLLETALLAILAYLVYLATCKEAIGWAINVRAALDTHLDAVADKLQLRKLPLQSYLERKERWQNVSQWLAYGGTHFEDYRTPEPDPTWYVAPVATSPGFEVMAPPNVDINTKRLLQRTGIPDPDHPKTKWVFGTVAHYVHLVTTPNTENTHRTARVMYLSVSDRQFAQDQIVQGTLSPGNQVLTAKALAGDDRTLIWNIGNIHPNSSFVLDYQVIYSVALEVEIKPVDTDNCKIAITNVEMKSSTKVIDDFEITLQGCTDKTIVELSVRLHGDHCLYSSVYFDQGNGRLTGFPFEWRSVDERRACLKIEVNPDTSSTYIFSREKQLHDTA